MHEKYWKGQCCYGSKLNTVLYIAATNLRYSPGIIFWNIIYRIWQGSLYWKSKVKISSVAIWLSSYAYIWMLGIQTCTPTDIYYTTQGKRLPWYNHVYRMFGLNPEVTRRKRRSKWRWWWCDNQEEKDNLLFHIILLHVNTY